MFVKCSSATSGERHENALPIFCPLLEGVHELSTDSGAAKGFDHQQFIDPGGWPACVKRGMAVTGDIADQPPLVLGQQQTG